MRPLYEITGKYKCIVNQIFEADDITPDMLEELGQTEEELDKKVYNISALIKNMEAENEAIENAMFEMNERSKRLEKKIESLREYLTSNLVNSDIKEVKTPYFDIKVRLNRAAVNVVDESLIPDKYIKQAVIRKIDKIAIKEDMESFNVCVPGAFLERKTRVEIR